MVVRYCETYSNLIPVAFVLGFYVSIVVSRWWEQFNKIPWPDRMALFITASVQGHDERGRLMRRTIMRYLCLSYVITMSSISPAVKKRFPTFQHMTEAGFMLANEEKIIEGLQTQHNKYFIPLVWSTSLVTRARKEGRIKDDFAVKTVIDELNEFRGQLGGLFNYDWISVPLVYTQVVTLAVYSFFVSCLMGRQFIERPHHQSSDVYVPVFTFLQFFFYMGWLKVAETLVNPFGEDDDDFDINQVIDRNLQVSYLIVDEMHAEHPELIKDAYWDEVDFELPYTLAAEHFRPSSPFIGSAMDINVTEKNAEFVVPGLGLIPEHVSDQDPVSVATHVASPTDIPPRRCGVGLRSPFTTKANFIHNFFKRSVSRNTENESTLGGSQQIKRQESLTSKGSESRAASPTITTAQDEIFNMSDLSDVEEDNPTDLEAAEMSDFWNTVRLKKMTNGGELDMTDGNYNGDSTERSREGSGDQAKEALTLGDEEEEQDAEVGVKSKPKTSSPLPRSGASRALTTQGSWRSGKRTPHPDSTVDLSSLGPPSPDLASQPLMQHVSQDHVDRSGKPKRNPFFERKKLDKLLKGKHKGKPLPRSASMGEGSAAPGPSSGALASSKSHSNPGGNVKT